MMLASFASPGSTVTDMLLEATQLLAHSLAYPELEARRLLAFTLGWPMTRLLAQDRHVVKKEEMRQFFFLVERRRQGVPLAHLTGVEGFWSLMLHVTPACLVPRPETECLVELALTCPEATLQVADLGTGSGAIALAMATERPHWQITATDCSANALAVAQANAHRLGITSIQWRLGDWCQPLLDEGIQYDLIISNPPYLAHDEQGPAFEPHEALYAGPQGTEALETIIIQSRQVLRPQGRLLLEHGANQRPWVISCLEAAGFRVIQVCDDGAALPRAIMAQAT